MRKPCYDRSDYWQCPDCKAGVKTLPDGRGIICPTCMGDAARPKAPRHPKVTGPLPTITVDQLPADYKSKLAEAIEANVIKRQRGTK